MNGFETVSANGREIRRYLATPDAGAGPGVLLVHPWWGLNDVVVAAADRLADAGLVVAAPDLYHGTVVTTSEDADERASALWTAGTGVADTAAAFERLADHPQLDGGLGVMGFSMGVTYALSVPLARPDAVDAAVLYYGTAGGDFGDTDMAVLGHFAEHDPFEPPSQIDAFEAELATGAGSVTFHTYPGTGHWFAESDRPEYDEAAAELAWSRTLALLRSAC